MADPAPPEVPPEVPAEAEVFADALQHAFNGALQSTPQFRQVPHGDGTIIVNPASVCAIQPRGAEQTVIVFQGTSIVVDAAFDDVSDAILDEEPGPQP